MDKDDINTRCTGWGRGPMPGDAITDPSGCVHIVVARAVMGGEREVVLRDDAHANSSSRFPLDFVRETFTPLYTAAELAKVREVAP